jgi:hypothetical protein
MKSTFDNKVVCLECGKVIDKRKSPFNLVVCKECVEVQGR